VEADLKMTGQRSEYLEVEGRQRRDAEDGDPRGQTRDRATCLFQLLDESELQRGRMLLPERAADLSPQLCLPALVGSCLPLPDQLGPEDQVLVEHVGDTVCQLIQ